jgi:predicted dithiol-disulfide oxidoreductase (DUF899 family)
MTEHKLGSREEWQAARDELLQREKEHTRIGDELARQRRELPWVRVEKQYRFETEEGTRTLAELFDGRSQLLVHHTMFGLSYEAACPICSSMADGFNGLLPHLHARDVTMLLVSRAPLEVLLAYKRRMGWSIPWASTAGNDFNSDFGVSYPPPPSRCASNWALRSTTRRRACVGWRPPRGRTSSDISWRRRRRHPQRSCSMTERSTSPTRPKVEASSSLWATTPFLDRAPNGRDEGDLPAPDSVFWIQRHDEYDDAGSGRTS